MMILTVNSPVACHAEQQFQNLMARFSCGCQDFNMTSVTDRGIEHPPEIYIFEVNMQCLDHLSLDI